MNIHALAGAPLLVILVSGCVSLAFVLGKLTPARLLVAVGLFALAWSLVP